MNKVLLAWMKANEGKVTSSPRSRGKSFEISEVSEKKEIVKIRFEGRENIALPLTFEMFERALSIISKKQGEWVRLGTSVTNAQPNTIEGEIWKKPFPINYKIPYKSASHVSDFLVLSGLAEYGKIVNPISGRKVQAIRSIVGAP